MGGWLAGRDLDLDVDVDVDLDVDLDLDVELDVDVEVYLDVDVDVVIGPPAPDPWPLAPVKCDILRPAFLHLPAYFPECLMYQCHTDPPPQQTGLFRRHTCQKEGWQ